MYENLHAPMPAYKEIKLYTGNGNRELAQKIADILHLELSGLKIEKFANGEIYCRFEESVTTHSSMGASCRRSMAGPEKMPWVAQT